MQLNKNIKIFVNYFLGPLLFVWLSYSIYRQIIRQPELEASWHSIRDSFQSSRILYLFAALLLVPLNWGLEAWKWKLSLQHVYPVSFLQAFKAVLSGISFSVTMPNRVGEYLGRMMYLPEGQRLKTISVTLVGSFAQMLITLIAGTIGFVLLRTALVQHFDDYRISSQFLIYGFVLIVIVLLLIYFNVSGGVGFFRRYVKTEKHAYLIEALESFHGELLRQLLAISFLRYLVFMIQYLLVFYLFGVNLPPAIIITVMSVVFLAMAIIPSIALVEVWLRGEIIIMLMGMYSSNTLGIGFTSVSVWFMNLIFPAIVGSLLLLNLRIFKKRNEVV
jgi:hypothetical protein